jgi:hypothetical protein
LNVAVNGSPTPSVTGRRAVALGVAAAVAAAVWLLRATLFGRQLVAVGGNEAAARLAGGGGEGRLRCGLRRRRRAAGHRRAVRLRRAPIRRRA